MMKGKDAGTRQEIRNLVAWQQKVKNNRKKLNRKTRVENRMGGKLGNTAKKPRFDPKVLSEIEGDILDEGAYEPNDTVSGAQRAVRKAANARIRQKLPDVENFVFDKGYHEEEPGIETVQDAQAFVKRRAKKPQQKRPPLHIAERVPLSFCGQLQH